MDSRKTGSEQFFPDEVITNILSRLPPKSVARCRLVCKGWKDITLPRDFVDLISRNSTPTILVTNPRLYSRLDLFAIDKWWEPAGTKPMIIRFPFYSGKFSNRSRVLFSHAGLIALDINPYPSSEANFVILNPASPSECVRITLSEQLRRCMIYGVYFHPILKEYCSLWKIASYDVWSDPKQVPYMILNLGSDPYLRTVSDPFIDRRKMWGASPVFINNYLYWLIEPLHHYMYTGCNDIMEFNIISEEFRVIPYPVPLNTECKYFKTCLLSINDDDVLSFFLIFSEKIIVCRLVDHVEKLWTTVEYTLRMDISDDMVTYMNHRCCKIVVFDEKVAILVEGRLLVINLKEGTMTNCSKRKYNHDVWVLSHQMSLASLNNCKSVITIENIDNKVVVAT